MVWVKWLSLSLAGFVGLIVVALTSVTVFVDPNDFKEELQSVALEKANVTLRLDGDISWSFFPWLGLELDDIGVALGSDAEILKFDRAEFGLAILPLFSQKIQVNKVNLINLKAKLNKDKNGQSNWELDTPESSVSEAENNTTTNAAANSGVASDTDTSSGFDASSLPEIQLDELRIENAQVEYKDEQTNQLIKAALNITLADVQWDKAWPMAMDVVLTQSDLQGASPMTAKAELNANLSVFPAREFVSLDSLVLSGSVASDVLPASPLQAKLRVMKFDLDLPQENVLIEGLALSALGMNIDARLEAYEVLTDPKFSAIFSLGEFNPRNVMSDLNIELPEMSDDTALTKVLADISLTGDTNTITAQPISIQLDDTKIEANAVLDLAPLNWDISIAGAELNLDRYLPEAVETEQDEDDEESVAVTQVTKEEGDLIPVDVIRGLNGHVGILFENIIAKNLKIDKIELESTQSNGLVKVSPLRASLYEGTIESTLSLDARGQIPEIIAAPSINGVQIQPLLSDFMELENIAGATFLTGQLNAKGNRVDALMASLQGDLLVEVKQGALVGTNVTRSVCEGLASLNKKTIDDSKFGEDTPFESMRFPAHIVDGQVSTPGLSISSAGIELTGDGVVSLTESSLNYTANVGFPGSALDDACQVDERVAKLTFPILCKGLFSDDPVGLCRPDFKGFANLFADLAKAELKVKAEAEKAKLKAELDAKIEAEKARLKAEFEAKKKAKEDELKAKLKNKLKDLF